MKIGILTHHYVNNFGAFLQAWALREAVARLRPEDEVQIIDYINIKHFIINTGGWFRFSFRHETLRAWLQKTRVPGTFAAARKELVLSKRCYSVEDINALKYDCIIVGSDEVWNYADRKSYLPLKFGKGLQCRHLIAYAPSVGNSTLISPMPEVAKEGICRFKSISVRDELTEKMVKELTQKTPARTLDPTFLSEFPRAVQRSRQKYLLFYYCDQLPEGMKRQILDYAKEHNMAVYGAGECDKEFTDITVNLTPFEWVEMFRGAEHVFTGTFHGAVFSILNRRQFHVYLTKPSRISKVRSLLAEFAIDDREMEEDFQYSDSLETIDYDSVDRIISSKREASLAFLRTEIEGLE